LMASSDNSGTGREARSWLRAGLEQCLRSSTKAAPPSTGHQASPRCAGRDPVRDRRQRQQCGLQDSARQAVPPSRFMPARPGCTARRSPRDSRAATARNAHTCREATDRLRDQRGIEGL